MRTDPAPSDPRPTVPTPRAVATAAPPEDPPAVRVGSHALRTTPHTGESETALHANSGMVVFATMTAPASRRRATAGSSVSSGGASRRSRLPRTLGRPRTARESFTVTGTPSKGPSWWPCRHRRVEALACSTAPPSSRKEMAPRSRATPRARPRTSSRTSRGVKVPAAKPAHRARTGRNPRPSGPEWPERAVAGAGAVARAGGTTEALAPADGVADEVAGAGGATDALAATGAHAWKGRSCPGWGDTGPGPQRVSSPASTGTWDPVM